MNSNIQLHLVGETFSPWTKKARWALEHCGLEYNYQEYIPTLSEPALRWKLKQISGKVSVPLLFVNKQVIRSSWNIAVYANEQSGDNRLGDMSAIKAWDDLSEAALAEGRTRVVRSIKNNKQALIEALPSFIPTLLRNPLRFMAYDAVRRLDNKYADLLKSGSINTALAKVRETLAQSNNDYLLDDFSYADITMAVIMEVIAPIAHLDPPLGTVTEILWNDEATADEFKDLVEWRNRLAENDKTNYSQFREMGL